KPHPLVIWHGLGDSAYAEGLVDLKRSLEEAFPGLFVHIVSLEEGESADRKRTVFGSVNDDVDQVCEQLKAIPELEGGMDAIGFSQGGQFLRAVVQRCEGVKVRNLVTFGSQHMGIADFPACKPADFLCRLAEGALRAGIYTDYAQSHVVSAQYYRNPRDADALQRYLETNHFLADINNEVEQNDEYKERLSTLDSFVMLQFSDDVTVVPKRSSWFESYPEAKRNDSSIKGHDPDVDETTPLRQSEIYTSDRLGLRSLDKRGSLVLDVCKGPHMHIDSACQLKVFGKYVGTPKSSASTVVPAPVRHGWARTLYATTGLR
ncbi:alpha/beta-hydrolase, partial [Jaminaea rosea]